jgi:hypothetical protein
MYISRRRAQSTGNFFVAVSLLFGDNSRQQRLIEITVFGSTIGDQTLISPNIPADVKSVVNRNMGSKQPN